MKKRNSRIFLAPQEKACPLSCYSGKHGMPSYLMLHHLFSRNCLTNPVPEGPEKWEIIPEISQITKCCGKLCHEKAGRCQHSLDLKEKTHTQEWSQMGRKWEATGSQVCRAYIPRFTSWLVSCSGSPPILNSGSQLSCAEPHPRGDDDHVSGGAGHTSTHTHLGVTTACTHVPESGASLG